MKKTAVFGLLLLMVVGMVFATSIVSAYRGDYTVEGPSYNEERHELMENAFDRLDYDAWYNLMTEDGRQPKVIDVVTESKFETFAQAHEAGKIGDLEKASALRAELGLNNGNGPEDGSGYGKGQGTGKGQRMQQNNFINAENNGNCDSSGFKQGRWR